MLLAGHKVYTIYSILALVFVILVRPSLPFPLRCYSVIMCYYQFIYPPLIYILLY